ncbi:unnamed protein product [Diamesa hyperborea]
MREIIQLTCLLVTLVSSINAAPSDLGDGSQFLMNYGYLSDDNSIRRSSYSNAKIISEAIEKYQRFYGLNITGELNKETRSTMEQPRCGVKDINLNEMRRYKLNDIKWNKKSLTYRVSKYTKKLKSNSVDDVFRRAFKMWSDVSDLKFTQNKKGSSDIDIKFVKGLHGDFDPFDGPGRTLAHASLPDGQSSNVHFDDDETFTDGVKKGINLLYVAAHEFGHSLGLQHSEVKSSLMFPSYSDYEPKLHSDDIKGIQALYGKSKTIK